MRNQVQIDYDNDNEDWYDDDGDNFDDYGDENYQTPDKYHYFVAKLTFSPPLKKTTDRKVDKLMLTNYKVQMIAISTASHFQV